jgi:hypothetical protein
MERDEIGWIPNRVKVRISCVNPLKLKIFGFPTENNSEKFKFFSKTLISESSSFGISIASFVQKIMKNKLFPSYFFLLLFLQPFSQANTIGYIEDFALAPDREAVLKDLIPGTKDYYYYHALHAQHEGKHDEVEKLIGLWVKRYGETSRVREIQNRAALLEYEKNPSKSMEYLRKKLGLRFNHSRVIEGRKPSHPTKLDPQHVSYDAYYQEAIRHIKIFRGLNSEDCVTWMQINSTVFNYATFWDASFIQTYPDSLS